MSEPATEYIDTHGLAAWLTSIGVPVARALAQWRLLAKGPPFLKVGGRVVRYRVETVRAWLLAQTRGMGPRDGS